MNVPLSRARLVCVLTIQLFEDAGSRDWNSPDREERLKAPLADLRAQYYELKEQIDSAIVRVIESCRFSGGDVVSQLEDEIAHTCGAEF